MLNELIITKKGKEILETLGNKKDSVLEFTKIRIGAGSPTDDELSDPKMESGISSIRILDKYVLIKTAFDNYRAMEGFRITEIGLFALDEKQEEVLYAVSTCGEDEWIYIDSGENPVSLTLEFYLENINTAQLIIKVGEKTYVLTEDYEDFKQETDQRIHKLKNFRTIYYDGSALPYTALYGNTLTSLASMINTRGNHTATLYNRKIYVVGGTARKKLEIYDIATDTWTEGADLNYDTIYHQVIAYNGKLYAIGGYLSGERQKMEIYDIANNTWSMGPEMLYERYYHTATLYGGKIYVIGGEGDDARNTMEIYDIAKGTWEIGPSLTYGRRNHSAVLYRDKIYLFGGNTNANRLLIYDITNNILTTGSNAIVSVYNHTATLYGGKIYVIGGSSTTSTRFQVYDIATDTWIEKDRLQYGRSSHAAIEYEGKIYVFGGSGRTENNEVYNIKKDLWIPIRGSGSGTSIETILYNGKIYLIGGSSIGNKSLSIYEPAEFGIKLAELKPGKWLSSNNLVHLYNKSIGKSGTYETPIMLDQDYGLYAEYGQSVTITLSREEP